MTHNFFLNLMSVLFPLLCVLLTFVPGDFNYYLNSIARWLYKRFNVAEQRRSTFHLNETALRFFGIIGLMFSMAMIFLMFYRPAV